MKIIPIVFGILTFLFLPLSAYAQTPTPVAPDKVASSSALNKNDEANLVINSIEDFFKNFDSVTSGMIFSTPNVFEDTIKLTDGSQIKGLNILRNIFLLLSIPLSAFIIIFTSSQGMISGQATFLKAFAGRIIIFIVFLFLFVPFLSLSIQSEVALTNVITSIPSVKDIKITSFINDYYAQGKQQIATGKSTPENIGIPSIDGQNFFSAITHSITVLLLFLISVIALIFGSLFIIIQFVLRFVSMLFMSLIAPIIIPFILSSKTERIVNMYIRIWFTFLIHQPAFALGYVMIMIIMKSILISSGATIGLLFTYIASLFFLGTINVLTSRIFADAWIAMGANIDSNFIAHRLPVIKNEFKQFYSDNKTRIQGYRNIKYSSDKKIPKRNYKNYDQLKYKRIITYD